MFNELKEKLAEVSQKLTQHYGHEVAMQLLSETNDRLVAENERLTRMNDRLLDRLMARDFEKYALYREEPDVAVGFGEELEPTSDEANVGEVIEDETTGRE